MRSSTITTSEATAHAVRELARCAGGQFDAAAVRRCAELAMRAFDALDLALDREASPLSAALLRAATDAYWYALVLVRTTEVALASAPHANVAGLHRSACRMLGLLERVVDPALISMGTRLAPERVVAPRREAVRA